MSSAAELLDRRLRRATETLDLRASFKPRGIVQRTADGVAFVIGLDQVGCEELLAFDCGAFGMAHDLGADGIGVVLLSGVDRVRTGDTVFGLNQLPQIKVGQGLLGRIIDPLGNPLDDGPPVVAAEKLPLFRPAPEFIERKSVDDPLLTGILAIDAAVPIGRGQRELIIGDRNTGKSALALDIVSNQHFGDITCVYVVIGQPISRVLAIRDLLDCAGCLRNTVIVSADASATPGLQYLAPYAGASVAEWFCEQGQHALIIYDDLTKHADAYRELSLLLGRPPGREAFPGDIFYIHAELLERACARNIASGGGSVTAFPIVETTDSDISGYIPTNLISITDGQIYLDTARFERNHRPAIDLGRSVSRIGSAAQPPAMRAIARNLRILMSRFETLESLTRVGLDVDESTLHTVRRGRVVRELLRQSRFEHRSVADQVVLLTSVNEGWLDGLNIETISVAARRLLRHIRLQRGEIMSTLDGGQLPAGWPAPLNSLADSIQTVLQTPGPDNGSVRTVDVELPFRISS